MHIFRTPGEESRMSTSNMTPLASFQLDLTYSLRLITLILLANLATMRGVSEWKLLSRVRLFATLWAVLHGILWARILEWVAFPFSRRSSQPRDQTQVSHIEGGFCISWATREAQEYRKWVAYPFSRGSFQPRNWTGVSCIAGRFLTNWAMREALLWGEKGSKWENGMEKQILIPYCSFS